MSLQLQAEASRPRSFFQTPAFWVGSVLWLSVLVAGVVVWNQRPREQSMPAVGVPGEEAEAPSSSPKQITITTDKDGNAKVLLPGENPGSPWDKDGIADFSLIDTDGKRVTRADLLGKPWIVCFVFTHCALTCPAVTNSMRELQDRLKDYDFRLVTLTVDPVRDTPEVLKEYGKGRGADFSKWKFLGGDQRDIYRLIQGSFKMPVKELDPDKRQVGFEFIHSNNIMLVDEKGVVRGKYDATKGPETAALRREIQKMAKRTTDAAEPKPTVE
jgi:protein SCO1/2/putative membrane protein